MVVKAHENEDAISWFSKDKRWEKHGKRKNGFKSCTGFKRTSILSVFRHWRYSLKELKSRGDLVITMPRHHVDPIRLSYFVCEVARRTEMALHWYGLAEKGGGDEWTEGSEKQRQSKQKTKPTAARTWKTRGTAILYMFDLSFLWFSYTFFI